MEKSVLITGASTGIGATCALWLDRRGFRVFAGVRSPDAADRLREAASRRLVPLLIDVTKPAQVADAAKSLAEATGGRLDGLVNNAGIVMAAPMELLALDALRTQFEVNVIGQLAVTQACLPLLRAAHGRIVNMSSISGTVPYPLLGAYAASKCALNALSETLRMELGRSGIHVASIIPGAVATPIWEKSANRSQENLSNAGTEELRRYAHLYDAMSGVLAWVGHHAIAPEKVAHSVEKALTAHWPRARYYVGADARFMATLRVLLPEKLCDQLVVSSMLWLGRSHMPSRSD